MNSKTLIPDRLQRLLIGLIALLLITVGTIQLFEPSEHPVYPVKVLVELGDKEMREARNSLLVVWGITRALNAGVSLLQDADVEFGFVLNAAISPLKILEPLDDQIERMSEWLFYLVMFSTILSFIIEPLVTFGLLFMGIGLLVEFVKRYKKPVEEWKFHYHLIWVGGYGVFFPLAFFLVMLASDIVVDKRIEVASAKFRTFGNEETINVNVVDEEENIQQAKIEEKLKKQLSELQKKYEDQRENLMQYLHDSLTDLSQMEEFDPSNLNATPNLLNQDFSHEVAQFIVNSIIEGASGETSIRGMRVTFDFSNVTTEFQDKTRELTNSESLSLESIELLADNYNENQSSFLGKFTDVLPGKNELEETIEEIGVQILSLYEELNETREKVNDLNDENSSIIAWFSNFTGKFLSDAHSIAVKTSSLISEVVTIIEVGITLMALYLIKLVIFPVIAIFGGFLLFKVLYKRNIKHIIERTKIEVDKIQNTS